MKAIENLRPTLRVVVQIQQLQERSLGETAEALGISLTATKGRLFHARNALRRSMIPGPAHQPRFARRTRVLSAIKPQLTYALPLSLATDALERSEAPGLNPANKKMVPGARLVHNSRLIIPAISFEFEVAA
jgi:hypothetical protein